MTSSLEVACSIPADPALPVALQRCKHDDDGVVSGRSLYKAAKFITVHSNDGTLGGPLHHLCHFLRKESLHRTQTIVDHVLTAVNPD